MILSFLVGKEVKQITYQELQSEYKILQNIDGEVSLCTSINENIFKNKPKPKYPEKPIFLYDVVKADLLIYTGDNIEEQRIWVENKTRIEEWMDFIQSQPSRWIITLDKKLEEVK